MKNRILKTAALVVLLTLVPNMAYSQYSPLSFVPTRFYNAAGSPLALGWVCTSLAGTTSPVTTYKYATGTEQDNPIHLSASGQPPGDGIFITGDAIKISLYGVGSSNTCNGQPVGALIKTVDNITGFPAASQINNVQTCARSGANAGAKIIAAIAALPSTGGTVDCTGLQGNQTITANVFSGVTKPVTLLLGAARYTISASQIPGSGVVIKGSGWINSANAPKGHASWATAGSGTVLAFSLSSGILFDMTSVSGTAPQLSDMMIIGNGGTSIGISLGDISHAPVQANWGNLLVANTSTGYIFTSVQDSTFTSLRSRGNSSGISLGVNANQNQFYNTEIQQATVHGIDANGASLNGFTGLLIQAMTSGDGIYLNDTGNNNNAFRDIWLENNSGFSHAINVLGAVQTVFSNLRLGTGYEAINIGPSGTETTIEYVRNIGCAPITNAGDSSIFIGVLGGCPGTFTDTGASTIYFNDPNQPSGNATKLGLTTVTNGLTANTIVINGDAPQNHLLSGTYTPTLTNISNVSSSTAHITSYLQVGKTVTVGGYVTIAASATGNIGTQVNLSLPVTNGLNVDAIGGTALQSTGVLTGLVGFVVTNGTTNAAFYGNNVVTTASVDYYFSFTYHLNFIVLLLLPRWRKEWKRFLTPLQKDCTASRLS